MSYSRSVRVTLGIDYDTTRKDIEDFIRDVPDDAKPSVHVTKADRYYESDYVTLSFDWEEGGLG